MRAASKSFLRALQKLRDVEREWARAVAPHGAFKLDRGRSWHITQIERMSEEPHRLISKVSWCGIELGYSGGIETNSAPSPDRVCKKCSAARAKSNGANKSTGEGE